MRKVQLSFTLVGKSTSWQRRLAKEDSMKVTNKLNLFAIKHIVANRFGDRALVVANEDKLLNPLGPYPAFYAAGWFIDQEDASEMVVIGHGNTMVAASNNMMDTVKSTDWDEYSAKIVF